jgi:hypothetical protein
MLHVRLPFAMPYVFSALKIATTLAVIGAVVGEFVAAERGLGFLILFSTQFFKIHQAFAALVVLVAISLLLFLCCRDRAAAAGAVEPSGRAMSDVDGPAIHLPRSAAEARALRAAHPHAQPVGGATAAQLAWPRGRPRARRADRPARADRRGARRAARRCASTRADSPPRPSRCRGHPEDAGLRVALPALAAPIALIGSGAGAASGALGGNWCWPSATLGRRCWRSTPATCSAAAGDLPRRRPAGRGARAARRASRGAGEGRPQAGLQSDAGHGRDGRRRRRVRVAVGGGPDAAHRRCRRRGAPRRRRIRRLGGRDATLWPPGWCPATTRSRPRRADPTSPRG